MHDKRDKEQNYKDDEQNMRDGRRCAGDAGETQYARDDRDNEKYQSPL
jgi:hypothetical protein